MVSNRLGTSRQLDRTSEDVVLVAIQNTKMDCRVLRKSEDADSLPDFRLRIVGDIVDFVRRNVFHFMTALME
jgi:hypothetical protein